MQYEDSSWVGFDLDGTLAHSADGNYDPNHIGAPIPAMLERLRNLLNQGRRVKIFTARATVPQQIPAVKNWLREQGLPDLEVTNVKDYECEYFYDDRAVEVIPNTGRLANPLRRLAAVDLPDEGSTP